MNGNEKPLIGNPETENKQVQVLLSAPFFPRRRLEMVFTAQIPHKIRLNLKTKPGKRNSRLSFAIGAKRPRFTARAKITRSTALAAWLEPFRKLTGNVCPITAASVDVIWQQQFHSLCDHAGVSRKRNGLRHAFCSFHFALHSNENLTAA
jgi:hypothetical protein